MAEILRGKHKGRTGVIHQFCNDWFTIDIEGGESGVVMNPTSLSLDPDEVARVMDKRDADGTGFMFKEYTLNESTGLFKRIAPRRRRS